MPSVPVVVDVHLFHKDMPAGAAPAHQALAGWLLAEHALGTAAGLVPFVDSDVPELEIADCTFDFQNHRADGSLLLLFHQPSDLCDLGIQRSLFNQSFLLGPILLAQFLPHRLNLVLLLLLTF